MSLFTRAFLLACALGLGVAPGLSGQTPPAENPRLAEIQQDIAASERILVDLTNELERTQWQERLDLLKQDLENVQRREQLEHTEKALTERHRRSYIYALRDALRAIDIELEKTAQAIKVLNRAILTLREERVELQRKRQRLAVDAEINAENIADLDQEIRNAGEEILARALARDLEEMRLRLGEEANRIETYIQELPINPRPTIRLLLERRRYLAGEEKKSDDMTILLKSLQDHLGEIRASLDLSREKFANLDTEIELLTRKKQVLRNSRDLSQLFYMARSERKMCQDRIALQEEQIRVLGENIELGAQLKDVYDKESSYLQSDYADLLNNYWRRLMVPISVIIGILILYVLVVRGLLPRFYSREDLFVARRLGSYLVVLVILLTLSIFFLEDLKAIATVMGIAGAAVVIALQDLCSAFAGYFVIVASRKLAVGNRVEIEGRRGDVVDIQLLRTTLLELKDGVDVDEPTGRFIIIPNSFIFKSQVINSSHVHPYVWGKIDVRITFETPAQLAQDVLQRVLAEENGNELKEAAQAAELMEQAYGVTDTGYQPKLFVSIDDSGVLFRLLYVSHYKNKDRTVSRINRRIVDEFARDPRLTFAYPTQREVHTGEE